MDDDTTVHESLVEEVHRLRQQLADLQAAERQQVEERLQESATHYRELVHGSIQGIYIHQDYIIRFANPALASIFGYESLDLLLGTDIRSLAAPHELARLEAYKEALLRGEPAPSRYEYQGQRRDGTLLWLEAMFSVISWHGTPAILGTCFDIAERKQADVALAAEARFLRVQTAVAQVVLSRLHPEVLRPRLLEAIACAQGYSQGSFWRLTDDGTGVVIVATCGENLVPFLGLRRELDDPDSLVAQVFRHGRPIFYNRRQERLYAPHSFAAPANRHAFLGLPLRSHGGRVVEVLAFSDVENPERFSERDLVQGEILASQVAQALENSELFSQVQQLQEQYRVVTESLDDAVYTVDQQRRVMFANTALERLTGYRREELLGRVSDMFYTSDSSAMFARRRQQSLQGETLPPHLETEVIRKDGVRVPVELATANLVLHDHVPGRVVVARDISVRRRAEATMRENERRWRTLIENVRLVVVGLDLTGHVEYVNSFFLELTGYTAEAVLGQHWFDHFLPEAYKQKISNVHTESLSENLHARYQHPIHTRAGATRMIAWFHTRLYGAQGNIIGTLSIGEDITARQAAEEQLHLQAKNEELRAFAYTVSHDLKALLRGIAGYAQELVRRHAGGLSERAHFCLHQIITAATHLDRLLEDLLRYARLERETPTLTAVPLRQVLEEILHARSQQIVVQGVAVRLEVPENLTVYGWQRGLVQALTNLVDNALKFSRHATPPRLTISTARRHDTVRILVADNGIGFDIKYQHRLFELFHRLVRQEDFEGTGAGLAIAKKALEKQGATIWAEAQPGAGATFIVELLQPPPPPPTE